jgi:hypothetical protein
VVQFEFQRGKYTSVRYARFADDLLILIDSHPVTIPFCDGTACWVQSDFSKHGDWNAIGE